MDRLLHPAVDRRSRPAAAQGPVLAMRSAPAEDATSTVPIVMMAVGDTVGAGLVASLARPVATLRIRFFWARRSTPSNLNCRGKRSRGFAVLTDPDRAIGPRWANLDVHLGHETIRTLGDDPAATLIRRCLPPAAPGSTSLAPYAPSSCWPTRRSSEQRRQSKTREKWFLRHRQRLYPRGAMRRLQPTDRGDGAPLLGHSSISVASRYLHAQAESLATATGRPPQLRA